jgi:hypothetical protein
MTREEPTKSGDAIALTHLLATAAAGDTLMRDLYLGRARTLLEPICSEVRYRLLALVGGNARDGGTADLCGIGPADARDNVVMRFAVVRRERLAAGLL